MTRILGSEWSDSFIFELRDQFQGKDVFEISDAGAGKIKIRGNNGISLASGLNYYLRYWCNVDYNPFFGSQLTMPSTLPALGETILKFTDYEYRYALNFCTFSYSMAFWNWTQYEEFLDWAAMNGINLMLDIVGQEEVVRQTLKQYGYSDDEVREYLVGPAYEAWFYMQNLHSIGGPVPPSWFEQRTELARKIHDRMQTFGISPVIQGFSGQVPPDFAQKNPNAVVSSAGGWSGFTRPSMIHTYLTPSELQSGKEDYFTKVAHTFYQTQENVYGKVSHYYAVDPFHEGGTIPAGLNIVDINRTVQSAMLDYDADAIWVMQQWQNGLNEQKLSGLADKNHALVLDLQSDLRSQASPMESQQVPWIWNMLHNFGGRMGMDGVPQVLAENITEAYHSNAYMRGIGITPEAIENSPIVYELLFDMTWEQDPANFRDWTAKYAQRRYGGTDENIEKAWNILLDTAYKYTPGKYYQGASESIINAKPSDNAISAASTWGHSDISYDKTQLEQAAQLLLASHEKYIQSEGFNHDLVDVLRQVLQNSFQEYRDRAAAAYKEKDIERFAHLSATMLDIIQIQDQLLSTSDDFLLGTWINEARTMLADADDWTKDLFEFNARALISTWGLEKNSSLVDYSNRQWAGLTSEYYYPRWKQWADNRLAVLQGKESVENPDWTRYGWEWANRKSDQGDDGYSNVADTSINVKNLGATILSDYTIAELESTDTGSALEKQKNLAAGREVLRLDTHTAVPSMTDGNTATGWLEPDVQSVELQIDLEASTAINGVGFSLKQVPDEFALAYEIFVWDGKEWNLAAHDHGTPLGSNTEEPLSTIGSKVKFKFTSTNGQNLPGIYELNVWGADSPSDPAINIAQRAHATARTTQSGRPASNAIDGDMSTLWVGDGADPNFYQLTFDQPTRIDRVNLKFEQPDRLFKFKIAAIMPDGQEKNILDHTGNSGKLDQEYEAAIGEKIQAVKVDFVGSAGGQAWPAIAELELWQAADADVSSRNIAREAVITSSPTKAAPEDANALVDGGTTAWVSQNGAVPAWFELNYDTPRYVDAIRLHFEDGQPDRSMQYTLTATDAQGNTYVVGERSASDLSTPQGFVNEWPIGKEIVGIRMDIAAAKIPSSGQNAWPLVQEIEVMSRPENLASTASISSADASCTIPADDFKKLSDGDLGEHSLVQLVEESCRSIIITFDQPRDVADLVVSGNAIPDSSATSASPLRFLVQYSAIPESGMIEDKQWNTFADYSSNQNVSTALAVKAKNSIYTDALKLTFFNSEEIALNEIFIYGLDFTSELDNFLQNVRASVEKLHTGEYAGNYSVEKLNALVEVLNEADAAKESGKLSSRDLSQWKEHITEALFSFLREGFVTINRNAAYVAFDEASALIEALENLDDSVSTQTLADAASGTQDIIFAYGRVTQKEIDAAAEELRAAIDSTFSALNLSEKEKYDVALAMVESMLAAAHTGEADGDYPEQAITTIRSTIDSAKAEAEKLGEDYTLESAQLYRALAQKLKEAGKEFSEARIHVDASKLRVLISQLEMLNSADYDKNAWNNTISEINQAKTLLEGAPSQQQIDSSAHKLQESLDALKLHLLDRSILSALIAQIQTVEPTRYSEENWQKLQAALNDAIQVRNLLSTTQEELDTALHILQTAFESIQPLPAHTDEKEHDPSSETHSSAASESEISSPQTSQGIVEGHIQFRDSQSTMAKDRISETGANMKIFFIASFLLIALGAGMVRCNEQLKGSTNVE